MLAWPSALARRFGITQVPRLAFQLLAPNPLSSAARPGAARPGHGDERQRELWKCRGGRTSRPPGFRWKQYLCIKTKGEIPTRRVPSRSTFQAHRPLETKSHFRFMLCWKQLRLIFRLENALEDYRQWRICTQRLAPISVPPESSLRPSPDLILLGSTAVHLRPTRRCRQNESRAVRLTLS
jgi:hypothetical protein